MAPKAGDPLPDVVVYESPKEGIKLTDLFAGKKGILFGVPGAFTPGCSKTHLPGYVADIDKLRAKGVQEVACVSVNDPFVMAAWGESAGAGGKVRMLADKRGELAKALGIEKDLVDMLGSVRMQRFSAVIEDNKFKTFNLDDGLSCSLSNAILDQL